MDLPANIDAEIIEYLNLEYASYQSAEKLSTSDLSYEGEYEIDGKKVKYWKYPCSEKNGCWATVEPYDDGYMISMTTSLPKKK